MSACCLIEILGWQLRFNTKEAQDLEYIATPPVYEPICGEVSRKNGMRNNLMEGFVCMDRFARGTYGEVVSLEEAVLKLL